MRAAPIFNAPVAAVLASPRLGKLMNRNIAMLSYNGRRSGRTSTIPVGYRRTGDEVMISVNMPEAKSGGETFSATGVH